ncbi:iron-siderophore ABC transporter substrate-binding protein [Chlorogloeopsis sp. ULAP01]|uniref:iron-siderophore ABC transporter substrate-binding protein n=1 Tax=Chlorogloeopsis sp. ULAP01 TaxID=3056483 RepID=UPI0025AAC754|nr:iron-siderophore ABC transporter substrate-binding protein [Chlorogloeopsis sp. ULAP01]MDM9385278.1 iron-siderophore ABC transporter substrate-binding protein [Chlorogloeopsis sp. ULAP01]
MGKTCVPKNSQRFVTISQFTLGNALVLGVKPIGSTSDGWDDDFPDYLKNKAEGIQKIGSQYEPNLESILRLKPDLILGWQYVKTIYPRLTQISPTALGAWQGTPSWREHFNFIAEALGKKEIAQQAWDNYYKRIEELKIALSSQYQNKTISVIHINGSEIQSSAKNSFIGSILDDIGLQRPKVQNVVTPSGWTESISEEKLEEFDGDILFVTTFDNRDKENFKKLQQKPLWKTLKAVQQGHVYSVDIWPWIGSNLIAANAVIDDLYKYLINTP